MNAVIEQLKKAVQYELKTALIYGYFADAIQGPERLQFRPFFLEEQEECLGHASQVRLILRDLGERATCFPGEITDKKVQGIEGLDDMLSFALGMETGASEIYRDVLLEMGDSLDNVVTRDILEQILIEEGQSMNELMRFLGD